MAVHVCVCVCVCVCGLCLAESQVGPIFPRPWHPRDPKSIPLEREVPQNIMTHLSSKQLSLKKECHTLRAEDL